MNERRYIHLELGGEHVVLDVPFVPASKGRPEPGSTPLEPRGGRVAQYDAVQNITNMIYDGAWPRKD